MHRWKLRRKIGPPPAKSARVKSRHRPPRRRVALVLATVSRLFICSLTARKICIVTCKTWSVQAGMDCTFLRYRWATARDYRSCDHDPNLSDTLLKQFADRQNSFRHSNMKCIHAPQVLLYQSNSEQRSKSPPHALRRRPLQRPQPGRSLAHRAMSLDTKHNDC